MSSMSSHVVVVVVVIVVVVVVCQGAYTLEKGGGSLASDT